MFRLPLLKSTEFQQGRLAPHIFAGPALFVSTFDGGGTSDTDTTVGVKARLGLSFLITKNIGVFGEYQFTHFKPSFSLEVSGARVEGSSDMNTHHMVAGISFRF